MAKVLYSSRDVRDAIQDLLCARQSDDRVVILAAYIGSDAPAFIPMPEGVHIVCNPTPGATSANAIRELLRRGARVQFSDNLHMKVYWSAKRGCVITSANVTAHALAANGLREAGVFMPAGKVDIDRFLKQAAPRDVTTKDLARLDRERPTHIRTGKTDASRNSFDFLARYDSPSHQPWKLGCWSDNTLADARAARERARKEFGRHKLAGTLNFAKGQAKARDWFLCFEVTDASVRSLDWMYVNFVVPVRRSERNAYEKDYPFQAAQVHPARLCPEPPFVITAPFTRAFKKVLCASGTDWLWDLTSLVPSRPILRKIAERMRAEKT